MGYTVSEYQDKVARIQTADIPSVSNQKNVLPVEEAAAVTLVLVAAVAASVAAAEVGVVAAAVVGDAVAAGAVGVLVAVAA